jgi:hypothetical protein
VESGTNPKNIVFKFSALINGWPQIEDVLIYSSMPGTSDHDV